MKKTAIMIILLFTVCMPSFASASQKDGIEKRLTDILTYDQTKPVGTAAQAQIDTIRRRAQGYGAYPGTGTLWSDLKTDAAGINTAFGRVLTMAKGYAMGEALAGEIKDKVSLLCKAGYYQGMQTNENWWYYEIGIPQSLAKTVFLMRDAYTMAEKAALCETIMYFCPSAEYRREHPSVKETGANRLWKAEILLYCGVILNRQDIIEDAVRACDEVFLPVKRGDGFYEDGSFIQHDRVAYTGAYGTSLANSLTDIAYAVGDTRYAFSKEQIAILAGWAKEGFQPLMKNGAMMAMVRGRAIARSYETDHTTGHGVIAFLSRLSLVIENGDELKQFIKNQLQNDPCANPVSEPSTAQITEGILADGNIQALEDTDTVKIYAGMDRAVFSRRGVKFGISMSSSRIYNYESINDENLHGYHTGNGMTSIYNGASKQYDDGYWCTVDPYRLSGTTIDDTRYGDGEGSCSLNSETWCGGVQLDGKYGAAGMSLHPYQTKLNAKKSWFCIGDEFIALGAGITNDRQGSVTETVIENRKITKDAIVVNGTPFEEAQKQFYSTYWMHIDGGEGNRIGYYYPDKPAVLMMQEERRANWSAIRKGSNQMETNRFFTAVFNHKQAENAGYAYAVLPDRSSEETRAYARAPEFEILENSERLQAVKSKKKDITAVNFWEAGTVGGIRVNHSASVVVLEEGDDIRIALSDPERSSQTPVRLELEKQASGIVSCGSEVKLLAVSPKIVLEIDTSALFGRSSQIVLSKTRCGTFEKIMSVPYLAPDWGKAKVVSGQALIEKEQVTFSNSGTNRVEYLLEKPIEISEDATYILKWEQYVGSGLGGKGALNGLDGQYVAMNTAIRAGAKENAAGEVKPFLWWYQTGAFGKRTMERNTWYNMMLVIQLHEERNDQLSLYVSKKSEVPSGEPDAEIGISGNAAWEILSLACSCDGTGESSIRSFTIEKTAQEVKDRIALIAAAVQNEQDEAAGQMAQEAYRCVQGGLKDYCQKLYAGWISRKNNSAVIISGEARQIMNATAHEKKMVQIKIHKKEEQLEGIEIEEHTAAPGTVTALQADTAFVWETLELMRPLPLVL